MTFAAGAKLSPYEIVSLIGAGGMESKQAAFKDNYRWKLEWALLLAAESKHNEARHAMDEGTRRWAEVILWEATPMAEYHALLGEPSTALDWLEKAVRNGDERVRYFQKNARLASIRHEPRFQAIVRTVEARRAKAQ